MDTFIHQLVDIYVGSTFGCIINDVMNISVQVFEYNNEYYLISLRYMPKNGISVIVTL